MAQAPAAAPMAAPTPAVDPSAPSPVASALDAARAKRLDAQWTCKVFAANTANPLDDKTTVGTKFTLSCEGAVAPKLDTAKLALELPEAQKWALHVLETRSLTDSRGEFLVTSWMAGPIKLANPVLTDGTSRIALGEIDFTIASVIDKKQQPPPQPFPPWAPLQMPLPNWVWIGAGLVILAVVLGLADRIGRNIRRKGLLRLLDKNPIALTPFHQFNKDLRKLARQIPTQESVWDREMSTGYIKELTESFKWFVSRELVLAAFERNAKELARDIVRSLDGLEGHKDHETFRRDLRVTLAELEKAQLAETKQKPAEFLSIADAQQLTELARNLADQIHEMHNAAPGPGKERRK